MESCGLVLCAALYSWAFLVFSLRLCLLAENDLSSTQHYTSHRLYLYSVLCLLYMFVSCQCTVFVYARDTACRLQKCTTVFQGVQLFLFFCLFVSFFFFGVRFLYFSAGGKKKGLPSLLGSIKVFPELIYLCHKVEAYYFLVRSQNSTDAMKNGAQTFLRTKRFVFFFFCFLKMVEKCDYSREWRFYFFFF